MLAKAIAPLMIAVIMTCLTPKSLADPPPPPEPKPVVQQSYIEPSRGGAHSMTFEATAYCLPGRTATGTLVGPGTISVDPKVIPLGSRLWVECYGEGVALDTGGAIEGHKIDIWLSDYDTCIQFGRRKVEVRILEVGD